MPLADLQDISVSSAIYLQDSEGQKAFGTLVEAKMLRLLESNSLGIYASATAQGTPNGRIGTTNIYRKPRNLQTEEYDPTNTSTQIPTYDTIKVDVDKFRALRWQDETFDLDRLETIPVSQLISEIARSGFMSITAELDAFFISEVIKAAGEWATENDGANIIKADFQSLLTTETDNIREMGARQTLRLTHEIAKITKRFDRYTYGLQQSELLTIIDPEVMPMINTGFQGYAGDNLQIAKNTTFSTQEINGVTFATHPLVGQNLPAGSAFSLDQAYNTQTITIDGVDYKVAGILIHKEAYAMPIMTQPKIRMAINPNNMNDIFMIKWSYGGGVIRPNMFWLIVDAPLEDEKKKELSEILTETNLTSVVPSPADNGGFDGGQVVDAIIAANPEITPNDVSVDNITIVKDASGSGAGYVNGDYTADAIGAGKYQGTIQVKGKFGRLNP